MTVPGWQTDGLKDLPDEQFREIYDIRETIGMGGTGEVFVAVQNSLKRRVVVKVIRQDVLSDPTSLLRFEREAQILSSLVHSRVVQVYDFGLWQTRPYLVLEYVDGGSMAAYIKKGKPLTTREATRVMMQICEGLAYLHEENILHRDIKPGNILLTKSTKEPKISDFGLARPKGSKTLTEDGMVVGTLRYLAPETLTLGEFTPRSDLYSLGVMMYLMFSGRMPFKDDQSSVSGLIESQVNEPPVPIDKYRPDLCPELKTLINRLVAVDAAARPASAADIVEQLSDLLDAQVPLDGVSPELQTTDPHRGRQGPAPTRVPLSRRLRRHRRWLLPIVALLGVGIGMGLGSWIRHRWLAYSVTDYQVESGARTVKVLYSTGRECTTSLKVRLLQSGGERVIHPDDAPASQHEAIIDKLEEGETVEVTILFPDGSSSAPVSGTTYTPVTSAMSAARRGDRIEAALDLDRPAHLECSLVPIPQGPGSQAITGTSPRDLHHKVSLGPISPQLPYRLEAKLRLDNGEEYPLPARKISSPLQELKALTTEIAALTLPEYLQKLETGRTDTPRADAKEPAVRELERINYMRRRDEIALSLNGSATGLALDPREAATLYDRLLGVRLLERYLGAWGIEYRSRAEEIVPREFRWGLTPIFEESDVLAQMSFPQGTFISPSDSPLVDMVTIVPGSDNLQTPHYFTINVDMPARARSEVVEIDLTVSNTLGNYFAVLVRSTKTWLYMVPPPDKAFAGERMTLRQLIPRSLLATEKEIFTVQALSAPGSLKNPRLKDAKVSLYDSWHENFPAMHEFLVLGPR